MLKTFRRKIIENAILPVGDKLEGGDFTQWLRRYRKEQWLRRSDLEKLERERLSKILTYARSSVSFYKNIPKGSSDPFENIKRFPILTKTSINENLENLLAQPKEKLIAEASSGSSGVQGTVYMDKSARASQRAMQMLWFEWSGYKIGDSILQTGMTLDRGFIKKMKDFFLDTTYISAFDLDRKSIEKVLRQVEQKNRHYLFGYASSLFVLARTAIELGISNVKFKGAVSWGDKLFPHYRKEIQRAFGCETIDTYGCTEGAMIAAQCPEGHYHLSTNQCFIEIVNDEGERVPNGEMGNVVATRLDNFAMPLIRYYLGDLAVLDSNEKDPCACGRHSPMLQSVIGRDTDIVLTRTGKKMIVHFFTAIFEHIGEIRQFKVVQKSLDEMEIHYIPGNGFNRSKAIDVENKIHSHLKEKFPILWVETEYIAPTESGKPQIIQSFLKQSFS